jgi:DNA-binding response OmpR family regulator
LVLATENLGIITGRDRLEYRVTKVLIVEDDDTIAEGMAQHLAAAGLDAIRVGVGDVGLARLRYERPDVLVLDLMLPGLDGWSLIEQARAEGIGTPILVVSARGTEHDRVHALQIGADDYLVKPFSMKELVARVQAAARRGVRGVPEDRGEELVIEELRVDPRSVQAFVNGTNAELTPTEFRLLYALALDRGRVASRDELLQRIWGRRATHRDRTVDVCVRRLREKIDQRAPRHTFIQTRYGVGYSLEPVKKERSPRLTGRELPGTRRRAPRRPTNSVARRRASGGSRGLLRQEFRDQPLHTEVDLVADPAHRLDVFACRIFELPVLVALPREDRAGIAAAHRDHDVRRPHRLVREWLRELLAHVDA